MFVDFDEYPHYSGRESIIFEKYVSNNCFMHECTYVQNHINENDDKIDPLADSGETFSSSYFMNEPNETVEIIEAMLKDINMERIQDKGE